MQLKKEPAQRAEPKFRGEILLCEDNEINQNFIKNHLSRAGLDVVMACDGREGADIVLGRVSAGQKPFDLIFMDIHMPVMGGIEAARLIKEQGIKTPIVALTANVSPDDTGTYAANGMPKSLRKPFAPEELWECLGEYLTPVSYAQFVAEERLAEEEEQRRRLFSGFIRRNHNTFAEITAALEEGDVKLAHRLAHTLKGLAGLMGKKELQEAAGAVENALALGANALSDDALEKLGNEHAAVLNELSAYMDMDGGKPKPPASKWNKDAAFALFERLNNMLLADSAECRTTTDELREIPGTNELIILIEDYEFESAVTALAELRKTLNI